jgi:hypothetical protein
MDFKEAKGFVVLFGKFRNSTIDKIAESDDGLKWCDWMYGELEREVKSAKKHGRHIAADRVALHIALEAYLSDPTITIDLAALAKKEPRHG